MSGQIDLRFAVIAFMYMRLVTKGIAIVDWLDNLYIKFLLLWIGLDCHT